MVRAVAGTAKLRSAIASNCVKLKKLRAINTTDRASRHCAKRRATRPGDTECISPWAFIALDCSPSQAIVETFIAQEKKRGIKASRIVLAGFSQGGVIALHTGLRHSEKLGGIVALSTYLAMPQKLAAEANALNKGIPIFMAHGTADPTIRLEWAEASRKALEAEGHKVEWHTYRMQHSVSQDEVRDLGSFLRKVLG